MKIVKMRNTYSMRVFKQPTEETKSKYQKINKQVKKEFNKREIKGSRMFTKDEEGNFLRNLKILK